jgi:TRAP transporter T-component
MLKDNGFRCVARWLVLGLPLAGCNLNAFTVNSTAPVLKAGSVALDRESDPQHARAAAAPSLLTVETFLVSSPDNKYLLEILAQGYAQYPFAFLEDDLEVLGEDGDEAQRQELITRATGFYDRAFLHALHLASLHDEGITKAVSGDTSGLEKELVKFTVAEDAPGLYWMAMGLASAINLNKDNMDRVADLPKAIALLERVHTIAPAYFNHGAAMALGVVYASQGKAMGGDPDKARKMFDEVISATGGRYLMAKTLFARKYATVMQDRALFEKTLKEVLDTPASVWPDQRLANELARRRAARYLSQIDDLILPAEPQ